MGFEWLDHWVAACLVPLAVWILLSGLDDLFIDLVYCFTGAEQTPRPAEWELEEAPERRIAILVPLWREDRVIGRMLERNLALIRYARYDFFVGVYPNDGPTVDAVSEVARRHPRVHPALCPHDGPTSKGDCLNSAYRRMEDYEAVRGLRYELVIIHDAEDLIHPDSLRLINRYAREYEMIQTPVLPLATPPVEFTHGVYCDDFAEGASKDLPVRTRLGGFLPSNGVGTGFRREALDRLRDERRGQVFDPGCLTEDYEIGFRLHAMGCRQAYVSVRFDAAGVVATREYFPRSLRAAIRQRGRWVAGIALQGWERNGWRVPWRQRYWFWRDRKGLAGNLLSPVANLFAVYGLGGYLAAAASGGSWHLGGHIGAWQAWISGVTALLAAIRAGVRTWTSARIYGWSFSAATPVRMLWTNVVNCVATLEGMRQYFGARLRGRTPAWRKTEHMYPAETGYAASEAASASGD